MALRTMQRKSSSATSVPLASGSPPFASRCSRAPSAWMSLAVVTGSPRSCSGLAQPGSVQLRRCLPAGHRRSVI